MNDHLEVLLVVWLASASPMTDPLSEKLKQALIDRIPLGRMGTDREVAAAICFLASDEASYITGHVLAVNGGLYLA
jgi:3-oxoacyl-[acyl-carrier protein] reductase